MDLSNEFTGDHADLIECIKALLALDEHNVLTARDLGRSARSLLAAAVDELQKAKAAIDKLNVENAGLALDKIAATASTSGDQQPID